MYTYIILYYNILYYILLIFVFRIKYNFKHYILLISYCVHNFNISIYQSTWDFFYEIIFNITSYNIVIW